MIKVVYTDSKGTAECHSPALEAVELNYLSDEISKAINKIKKRIIVEFLEPNLTFRFTQTDNGYSVCVRFWDEQRNRKYTVKQDMSFAELEEFRARVDSAYNKYSNRFVKM